MLFFSGVLFLVLFVVSFDVVIGDVGLGCYGSGIQYYVFDVGLFWGFEMGIVFVVVGFEYVIVYFDLVGVVVWFEVEYLDCVFLIVQVGQVFCYGFGCEGGILDGGI